MIKNLEKGSEKRKRFYSKIRQNKNESLVVAKEEVKVVAKYK
ncbi:MAG TPA: hypothetical protein P5277_03545 [Candidatus Paceibacterota bacterium]|nr:hypothetical protein [Candidatus Paceibacterota bacterium]